MCAAFSVLIYIYIYKYFFLGWEGGGVKEVDEEAIHSRQSQWSRARKVSDKWKKLIKLEMIMEWSQSKVYIMRQGHSYCYKCGPSKIAVLFLTET